MIGDKKATIPWWFFKVMESSLTLGTILIGTPAARALPISLFSLSFVPALETMILSKFLLESKASATG